MSKSLSSQTRMAALIMKCGESRVWIDPDKVTKVRSGLTRSDIRGMIKDGLIKKMKAKPRKKVEFKKQRGGSRKGSGGARIGKKTTWLKLVRPQRALLQSYKKEGMDMSKYRKVYLMIKGGFFRNKAHLRTYLSDKGILQKKE